MSSIARRRSLKNVNLKKLHSDDIGQLKDTRASELGTIVKCYNHACAVAVKREVAQWYNEQNITITKLSRGQQKVYKSLLKFHQIKKDIKRKAHIKRQVEIQEKLREKAALEKKETELREISEKNANNAKKKKELVQKAMRKEKSILRSKYQVLPGIGEERETENPDERNNGDEKRPILTSKSNTQVTFEDQKDTVNPPTRGSILTSELSGLSGRISAPTYSIQPPGKHNGNFPHRYIEPPQNISRGNSFSISGIHSPDDRHFRENERKGTGVSRTKSPVKEPSFVDVIGKTETLVIKDPFVSDVSLIEAVNKANNVESITRNNSFARMKMTPPHFSRKSQKASKEIDRHNLDSGFDSTMSGLTEESNPNNGLKTPNRMVDLNPHKVLPSISNILVIENTIDDSNQAIGIDKLTKHKKPNRKKKRLQEKNKLLDDMNKYHVGILNRSFKLPNYKIPPVHHVTKYTRNSQGSLVASEQTVKPASEEFKLPSNRKAYMLRKALNTERANEPHREKKLKDFFGKMSDMDRDVQATPTKLKTRSGKRREPFRHHKSDDFTQSSTMRNNVYAYILGTAQGDVTDVKNCRYLRTQEEKMGSRRGKASSWRHHHAS